MAKYDRTDRDADGNPVIRPAIKPSAKCLFDAYWNRGMKLDEIANGCGVSPSKMRKWFMEYKIKTRSSSDGKRLAECEDAVEQGKVLQRFRLKYLFGRSRRYENEIDI